MVFTKNNKKLLKCFLIVVSFFIIYKYFLKNKMIEGHSAGAGNGTWGRRFSDSPHRHGPGYTGESDHDAVELSDGRFTCPIGYGWEDGRASIWFADTEGNDKTANPWAGGRDGNCKCPDGGLGEGNVILDRHPSRPLKRCRLRSAAKRKDGKVCHDTLEVGGCNASAPAAAAAAPATASAAPVAGYIPMHDPDGSGSNTGNVKWRAFKKDGSLGDWINEPNRSPSGNCYMMQFSQDLEKSGDVSSMGSKGTGSLNQVDSQRRDALEDLATQSEEENRTTLFNNGENTDGGILVPNTGCGKIEKKHYRSLGYKHTGMGGVGYSVNIHDMPRYWRRRGGQGAVGRQDGQRYDDTRHPPGSGRSASRGNLLERTR